MIISPSTPPAALADLNSVNQTLNNQIESSEQSRKATDTVQLSAEARNLANTKLDNGGNSTNPLATSGDNERLEATPDNEAAESISNPASNQAGAQPAQPLDNLTQQPVASKIDVVA